MLSVLHLCAGNLYGGIERIVAECAADRHLAPGMAPRFATCFEGRLAAEIDASGASCERLGDVRVSRPHTVVRARRRLAELLRADPPHIGLCHSPWTFGFAAPVLRRLGVPPVLWVHDRLTGRSWPERWASLTQPGAIIANSQFTAGSIHTMYPGVEPAVVYAPVRPAAAISAGERQRMRDSLGARDARTCVVIIASRFEPWKGHRELLTALAGIDGPWRLWIAGAPQKAGEASYEAGLRHLAGSLGIGARVDFLGERRDVRALMQAADVHCQPNNAPEPFGLAYVEALYASLPVITTNMGGAAEILDEGCGLLVPPGDEPALRGALARVIGDVAARRALGARGPARATALCDPARQLSHLASVLGAVAA